MPHEIQVSPDSLGKPDVKGYGTTAKFDVGNQFGVGCISIFASDNILILKSISLLYPDS